jgi:hypothetical protein
VYLRTLHVPNIITAYVDVLLGVRRERITLVLRKCMLIGKKWSSRRDC